MKPAKHHLKIRQFFFVVGTMAYILTVCQDSEVLVEIKSVRLNVSSVLWHAHSAFVNPGV